MIFKIFGKTFGYYVLADSMDGALGRVRAINPAVNDGVALDGHEGVAFDLVVDANGNDARDIYDLTYTVYAVSKGGCVLEVFDGERDRRKVYDLTKWSYFIQAR